MANLAPIKKEQHQNLKVAAQRNMNHVAQQHIAPVTAAEFGRACTSFPIFVVKDPASEQLRSVVMMGLEAGSNLYFKDGGLSSLFAPQSITMVPFGLGIDPDKEKTLTACVDLDSEFVGEDKELALFEENGDESELFKNVQESLGRLYENEVMTEKFVKEINDLGLLEEVELLMNFQNGEKKKLVGIFTINEPKLRELSDEQVLDFHKRGLFNPIHSMLVSVGQLNKLAQLHNEKSENKVAGVQVAPIQK